jgi:kumamolisin
MLVEFGILRILSFVRKFLPLSPINLGKSARRLRVRGLGLFLLLAGTLFTPRLAAVVGPATTSVVAGNPASNARAIMAGSIQEVPTGPQPTLPNGKTAPHVTRTNLLPTEESAVMDFNVSLKMRNFADLEKRLARGELISPAEMAAKYLPLASDYTNTANWLQQQGFTIVPNSGGLVVFARGTVTQVRDAFQVSFARVATDDGEFTSAVTAPSVPADLAPALIGVNGLQPHLRKHPMLVHPNVAAGSSPPYYPKAIAQAYGANSVAATGAGQTIAIVIDAFPQSTDLTTFWADCGIAQSTANVANVNVGAGPPTGANADAVGYEEACLDIEWSSSIAPAAKIRVYGINDFVDADFDLAYQQIYSDVTSNPQLGLHVVSLSYGGVEGAASQLQTDTQLFAQLASTGVTIFAASGDDGSSPYYPYDDDISQVESPASDPHVTGVGGTSLTLNTTTGNIASETAWGGTENGYNAEANTNTLITYGSGGGTSSYFPTPTWQAAAAQAYLTTLATPTSAGLRCVPDVSAAASPSTGCLIVVDGANETVGGTSWGTPTWSGFCTLINQVRANNNLPPLGMLNPKIYPLLGTANFHDITSGNNGAYSASVGYDVVTGLGTPNVTALAQTLSTVITPPSTAEVLAGQNAVFALSNVSSGETTFQWQRCPANSSTWSNLTDNGTYSGSATATLTINATTVAMDGDQFQCVVGESGGGDVVTPSAALVVVYQIYVTSTVAGQADNEGTQNGNQTTAQFYEPNDVVMSSTGNIFVADFNNYSIREISLNGTNSTVTTFAGSNGSSGDRNGIAGAARFGLINALAFDPGGNLYVADSSNDIIRKVLPNGNVTTVAGVGGTAGSTNGVGTAAEFSFPSGIVVDSTGNIFVADTNNHLIRKITISGSNYTVTTLAGKAGVAGFADGTGTNATFNFPSSIAVDASGNLYVADAQNNAIRKVTQAGVVTTLAGQTGVAGLVDGTGKFAQFNFPSGIAVDSSGNIYVADTDNNTIRKVIPSTGVVSTLIGQPGILGYANGVSTSAQFTEPYGLCVTSAGNIIIADTADDLIRNAVPVFAPQIQSPPASPTITLGQNATISLAANGTANLTYAWQALPVGNSTWTTLTNNATFNGTTTATLTINSPGIALNGEEFRCLVSNAYGSATTSPVMLNLQQAPAFTTQPASAIVSDGDEAQFTVAATGLPAPTYQWQVLPSGDGNWTNLTDNSTYVGSGTSTLTITAATSAMNGAQFECVAANGVSPNATSSSALLTVYPAGYVEWAGGLNLTGSSLLPTATPFGDTLPNLARYAMGIGAVPAAGQLPALSVQVVNGAAYLTLNYTVSNSLSGLQLVAQYSYDLENWTTLGNSAVVQLAGASAQTSQYQASIAIPASGTVFLRLVAQP